MKKLLPLHCLIAAAALTFATASFASSSYKGSISFTDEEKQAHAQNSKNVTDAAAQCLQGELARHKEFIDKYGVSAFYGDQSSFARHKVEDASGHVTLEATTTEERRAAIRKLGFPENYADAFIPDPSEHCNGDKCQNMMQPTSCIGLALKCLGKGFEQSGEEENWKKIRAFVNENGVAGDALLNALQALGWRIYYWTPDTSKLSEWDAEERQDWPTNPGHAWGYHAQSFHEVTTSHKYFRNSVDDISTMTNFGTGMPKNAKQAPFFVGIAHLGYHVFPGFHGTVIEGHSSREITDPLTIQSSPFMPINAIGGPNGGPGGAHYHSGIIALPPGF